MSAKVSAIVMSVSLALGAVSTALVSMPVSAQQKDRTVNPKVGAALQAALAAGKNKQYDAALAKVREAEAEKKTPFEQFKINETLAFIYGAQKKYGELAAIYEKQLEMSQFLTPEQSQTLPKLISQIYFSAQQYGKSIDFAKRYLQARPNDNEMAAQIGQAYYHTKDFKGCRDSLNTVISNAEKAGSRPEEGWLNYAQYCASSIGDDAAVGQAYEKLTRYYPKPDYWQAYLKRVSRNERSDLATFHWFRLMDEVDALKSDDDYTTYAQQAMTDYGASGEAVRVLDKGFSKKVLGANEKKKMRQQNTLAKAKEVAAADKARLAQLTTEAEAAATGEKNEALGMAYFGAEQYDQAITHLEKAIKKGGLKEPAHVKLTLGIAQLRKGQRDAARTAFKSVSSDPVLGKVASAWTIRSFN